MSQTAQRGGKTLEMMQELKRKYAAVETENEQLRQQLAAEQAKSAELEKRLTGEIEAKNSFYNDLVLYKQSCDELVELKEKLYRQVDEQQATIADMRNALEFYGNKENYEERYAGHDESGCNPYDDALIFVDEGAIARKALSNTAGAEYTDKLRQTEYKLNTISDEYKKLEHEKTLLNMALRAANAGNDTTDLRYSYVPGVGPEQLDSLCHGVIVHIPIDWMRDLIYPNTANAEYTERVKKMEEAAQAVCKAKADATEFSELHNRVLFNMSKDKGALHRAIDNLQAVLGEGKQ